MTISKMTLANGRTIEEIKPETSNKIKDVEIEDMQMPTLEVSDYEYGQSQETLDAQISTRNGITKVKTGTFTYNGGTGLFSVTGIGFRPNHIEIRATYASGNQAFSIGNYSSMPTLAAGTVNSLAVDMAAGTAVISSFYIIWVQTGAVNMRAYYYSMDIDGFTLNFGTSTSSNISCSYTCRG